MRARRSCCSSPSILHLLVRRRASDKYRYTGQMAAIAKTREFRNHRHMRCLLVTSNPDGVRRGYLSVHTDGLEHRFLGDPVNRSRRGC